MTGFEVDKVIYSYNGQSRILDGIELNCREGTVNVLLGLNGCGKTTLIKIMAGLFKPDEGSVRYGGTDVHALSDWERSKRIAYVNQHGSYISGYTVEDYLLLSTANSLKSYEEPGREEIVWVDECLKALGIEHLKDKAIKKLSGGQRQLVYICAALVQNSEIILLDEPTSALDMKNQNLVLEHLLRISQTMGKTVILSTHNPNHALFLGADVFLMSGGRIIDSGPSSEVITVERLKPVYGEGICRSSELQYEEISYRGTSSEIN